MKRPKALECEQMVPNEVALILVLPLTMHAILGRLSRLSMLWFPHLQKRNNGNMIYLLLGQRSVT